MTNEKREHFLMDDSDENERRYSPLHGVSQTDIVSEVLKAKNNLKITTSKELLSMTLKQQPYIIETLIPESAITAITAESGTGKSLFALILAHHMANGTKLFDKFEVKKSRVLYIDLEMDEDIIVSRYRSIIEEKEDLDFVHNQSWKIDEPLQYNWLKNTIINENYGVVILDTLTNIHNKVENSADEMKLVNEELLRLVRETGVTIIFLHHNRKQQRGDGRNQNSSRGSTEIINKVSSYLMLRSSGISFNENDNFVNSLELSQLKARRPEHMKEISFDVLHNKKTNKTTWNYVGYVDKKRKATEKAGDKIIELLKNSEEKEYTINNLAETIKGIGMSNIRSAVKNLVEEKILGFHLGTGSQNNTKFYFLIEE
jgi:RecA-family ATPase